MALVIALGFEFVNGFHDTANAVATVIYTHSLPAPIAVVWSGFFNFLGVLVSTGAVAFGIVSLLPVELILQVGSSAGFAMVFALLIAAIIWNLGTWYLGLPASSSHTLIGSIIGVGVANALMRGQDGTSGVDWAKATEIGQALLLSPLVGFGAAALLLLVMRFVVRNPALYSEPKGDAAPPWWIRGLLILTCTGVSFAHGSNDGQKGMGLIMLILIGMVPTAYALNRAMPPSQMADFRTASTAAATVIQAKAAGYNVRSAIRARRSPPMCRSARSTDATYPSLAVLVKDIADQVEQYGTLAKVPAEVVGNTRNDMYLASEAIRFLMKDKESDLTKDDVAALNNLQEVPRQRDQVHPDLGQDRGRHRARPRHHDRLEAHRRHGRREDRQDPPDLRAGRRGRTRRRRHHRGRRHVRPAGVDHPRAVVGHRRHHGGERLGPAMVDAAQHRDGLGADAARAPSCCRARSTGPSARFSDADRLVGWARAAPGSRAFAPRQTRRAHAVRPKCRSPTAWASRTASGAIRKGSGPPLPTLPGVAREKDPSSLETQRPVLGMKEVRRSSKAARPSAMTARRRCTRLLALW